MSYALEYGEDVIEVHADALVAGERVVLVDDLIATGGTAEAAIKLLRQLGAQVAAACFVIDLPDLGGAERLSKLGDWSLFQVTSWTASSRPPEARRYERDG